MGDHCAKCKQWIGVCGCPPRHRHLCHAVRCGVYVAPSFLMCGRHWRMVPRAAQLEVWAHYRTGQEIDKRPTAAYMVAHFVAVIEVAVREGHDDELEGLVDALEGYQ